MRMPWVIGEGRAVGAPPWLLQLRRDAAELSWSAGTRSASDACVETVMMVTDRRARLDAEIAAMVADSEFTPVVHRLGHSARDLHADRVPPCGRSVTGHGSPGRRSD